MSLLTPKLDIRVAGTTQAFNRYSTTGEVYAKGIQGVPVVTSIDTNGAVGYVESYNPATESVNPSRIGNLHYYASGASRTCCLSSRLIAGTGTASFTTASSTTKTVTVYNQYYSTSTSNNLRFDATVNTVNSAYAHSLTITVNGINIGGGTGTFFANATASNSVTTCTVVVNGTMAGGNNFSLTCYSAI